MGNELSIVEEMRQWEKNQSKQSEKPCNQSVNESSHLEISQASNERIEEQPSEIKREHKNQNFYKMLIDNLIEGILILDFKGTVLFANKAVANMIGFPDAGQAIGKNALDFVDKKYHKRIIKDQLLVRMGKGGFLDSYQINTLHGKKMWVEGLGCTIKYKGKKANVVFLRNISDRRKTWDSLIKLEKKYRAIAEMSADGILTLDTLGTIRYVNPSLQTITKYKESILIGKLFRELLSDDSIYQFQQLLLDVRSKSRSIKHVELEITDAKDNMVPIELSISPLFKEGLIQGFVCTVHDITDRKRAEEEMRKSEQLKTEFMNIAAHELKSPVTPIKGYLDLIISDDKTDEKIKKWAKVSLRNAERLLLLVNDILDVSRLDNDSMRFEMKRFSISELLDEIVEDMRPSIEGKELTFSVSIPKELPEILGDFHRLQQVLKNLFTNALKFTDEGTIGLSVSIHGDSVCIIVSDTGIGIDQDELETVFEKFYQADTADSRKHEGTGLGLFICNEIIKKHKGTIIADSNPGEGSTFTITLPILDTKEDDNCQPIEQMKS
ncbi:MAG TPA: PAS domain-containing sensor histidine kinase [Candidatus Thermoplasmatota archaeon]|nr:PAS domain-containing sensor histidine kinase [Candidatus Thermoplasmatota archaeon]